MTYKCPSSCKEDLFNYCRDVLMPYMTRRTPNLKYSAYYLKHVVENEIGRYVSEEELVIALAELGMYPSKYRKRSRHYPISENYFKYVSRKRLSKGRGYNG